MRGFCCGAGELEISSGVAPQQTEVKLQYFSPAIIKETLITSVGVLNTICGESITISTT